MFNQFNQQLRNILTRTLYICLSQYLRNLDLNSAYYDPKTRAMRENPYSNTGMNPDEYAISVFSEKSVSLTTTYKLTCYKLFCVTEWDMLETTLFAIVGIRSPWLKHNVSAVCY